MTGMIATTSPARWRKVAIRSALLLGLGAVAFGVANSRLGRTTDPMANDPSNGMQQPGSGPATPSADARAAGAAAALKPRLVVTYRLDPSLTRGLYLGDRWVSPPEFRFAQPGDEYVVQAKLQSIDEWGDRSDLTANWSASDPAMVAITREPDRVTLVVREAGESRVTVTSGSESKVLRILARQTPDAMDVAIMQ